MRSLLTISTQSIYSWDEWHSVVELNLGHISGQVPPVWDNMNELTEIIYAFVFVFFGRKKKDSHVKPNMRDV